MSKIYCPHGCIDPCTKECVEIRDELTALRALKTLVGEVVRLHNRSTLPTPMLKVALDRLAAGWEP